MNKIIPIIIVLMVVGMWVCGNAAWILILANLIWLLVKGHVLVSWWWPIGTGTYTVLGLLGLVWLKIAT